MNGRSRFAFAAMVAVAIMLLAQAPAFAASQMVRKVDNFIVLFDMSGSMSWRYGDTDARKADLALADLKAMNELIPELGYNSGLATVASYRKYAALAPYSRSGYAANFTPLGEAVAAKTLLGPATPLGDGIRQAGADFKDLSGKTAIIIFSDGGQNTGRDPVVAAETLHKNSGGNICFHTVSYATRPHDQAILDEIATVGNCGYAVTTVQLADPARRAQFVKDVFYTETVAAAPLDPDSDGDGVPDSRDACPDTPRHLKVDARGCPIPIKMRLEILFDFDKSDIKPAYVPEVEKVAALLRTHPEATVLIEGHTDNVGSAAYNMALSQRRAKAVEDYLETKFGIAPNRVTSQGFGLTKPIADNATEEGRAHNRRVEATFQNLFELR